MGKRTFRKRHIGLVIKVIIAIVALWFIYREVKLKDENTDLTTGVNFLLSTGSLPYLVSLVALMLGNWMLEAYKWRLLISGIEYISPWKSLKAIFSGITIAIFTPNRIGEYGGRVFHLNRADRLDATLLTVVGSYAQLVVTLIMGLLASIFFVPNYMGLGPITPLQYNIAALFIIVFCIFLIMLFLNTRLLTNLLKWLPIPERYGHYAEVFQYHGTATLWKIFLASLGRYLIFTFQFYLLLCVFHVEIGYIQAMMMIALTYFVMAAIPTIAITELGVRGSMAVYFLGMLSTDVTGIFTASSMLWLINLAVPALIGVIFIFDLRFFRRPD